MALLHLAAAGGPFSGPTIQSNRGFRRPLPRRSCALSAPANEPLRFLDWQVAQRLLSSQGELKQQLKDFRRDPKVSGARGCGFSTTVSKLRLATRPFAAAISSIVVDDGVVVKNKDERPIVVIDNYDSFTYNLCQYLGELGVKLEVYRNDEVTIDDIKRRNPRGILVSPGPGTPQDSGISLQAVFELGPSIPLFGVCMGLQCIGEAFGGKIVRAPHGVVHGKSSLVYYDEKLEDNLFQGLPNPFTACRYHSLVIEKDSFPSDALEIMAWTEDGLIMAARHKKHKHIQGVQFHPESIMTTEGKAIISNFVNLIYKSEQEAENP